MATGKGFSPGGANGGRRRLGGECACARETTGQVYKGVGGWLGGCGVNHVAGASAAWAARRCDVRRGGGQWRAAVGTPASGN
jgi:hypothetical protein